MKVTLDTNCLIDLEENRPAAVPLRELIQMSSSGLLQIGVVGISASENVPGGGGAPTFATFQQRVSRLGLASAEVLKPMGILGVTYYDWCLFADDAMEQLAQQIHLVLFAGSEYGYAEYCAARGFSVDEERIDPRWRNQRCDVLALWSHIHYGRDVFVTRDANFMAPAKRNVLEGMGAGNICSPTEAVLVVRQGAPS